MAKDHGPSVKNDKQYEGLREKGMSKERAAKIANSPGSSKARRQELGLGHQTKRRVPGRHQGTEGRRRTQGRQKEQLVSSAAGEPKSARFSECG